MANSIVVIFFLQFCSIVILPVVYGDETCLACLDSPQTNQCRYTRQCLQGEKCYNDMFITPLGTVEYEMGCRDELQCLGQSIVGKRSFNNLTRHARAEERTEVCSGCCHGNLCNAALCGQIGFPPQTSARGPVCYSCDQQKDPDSCNIIRQCGRNEQCMIHLNSRTQLYDSKCIESHVCHAIIGALQHTPGAVLVGKKRNFDQSVLGAGNKCLAKCCSSDVCNRDCVAPFVTATSTVTTKPTTPFITKPTTASATNPCLANPCIHGTCAPISTSYKCTCQDGFTGRNCDVGHAVVTTIIPLTTPVPTMPPTTACVDITPTQTCQIASAYICQNVTMATDVGCSHYCGFC